MHPQQMALFADFDVRGRDLVANLAPHKLPTVLMPSMPPRSLATARAFAARLRALRTAAGLTLHQAAQRAGVDAHTLSRLERGDRLPDVLQLRALAQLYGTSMDALVDKPDVEAPA